jgi:transcriptional regulator GlxA family with amidase domain
MRGDLKKVGIVLFAGVNELEAIGPWEVLSYWARSYPQDGYETFTVARRGGLIQCEKGLVLQADHASVSSPVPDVLVYPGGQGAHFHVEDHANLEWVRQMARSAELVASVSAGSLVYAAAGLLENRQVSADPGLATALAKADPTIEAVVDNRLVDAGDVITAARTLAAVDMALHLIGRLHSADRAKQVRDELDLAAGSDVLAQS